MIKTGYTSLLLTLAMTIPAYSEGVEIGVNSAVKGSVTLKSADQEAAQARIKEPVYLGDEIDSKLLSSLQILLKDKTTFTVGSNAKLTIDEFIYDPKKDSNKFTADVKRGMFRFMSGNVSKNNPNDVTINTPTSSLGIRGTMFEAIVGPEALLCAKKEGVLLPGVDIDHNGATLIVLRGPGEQSNSSERKGEIQVTSAGKTVTLNKSGSATLVSNKNYGPSEPFFISEQLFNYFNRHLRTVPKGDENFMPFEIEPRLIRPDLKIEDEEGLIPYNPNEDLDLPRIE